MNITSKENKKWWWDIGKNKYFTACISEVRNITGCINLGPANNCTKEELSKILDRVSGRKT